MRRHVHPATLHRKTSQAKANKFSETAHVHSRGLMSEEARSDFMFAESDMHMLLAKPTSTSRLNGISLAQKRRSIQDGSQRNAGEQIGPKIPEIKTSNAGSQGRIASGARCQGQSVLVRTHRLKPSRWANHQPEPTHAGRDLARETNFYVSSCVAASGLATAPITTLGPPTERQTMLRIETCSC